MRNESRHTPCRRRGGAEQSDRLWGRLVQVVKGQDDAPAANGSALVEVVDVESIERENLTLKRTVTELQHEVQGLRQRLKDRKVIERAKGLIMEANGLSEDQAYRVLRQTSMDSNQPMAKVAKAVILAHKTGRVGPVPQRAAYTPEPGGEDVRSEAQGEEGEEVWVASSGVQYETGGVNDVFATEAEALAWLRARRADAMANRLKYIEDPEEAANERERWERWEQIITPVEGRHEFEHFDEWWRVERYLIRAALRGEGGGDE